MHSSHFGTLPCGQAVEIHTLSNPAGSELKVLTYGGIVTSLRVPDRHGHLDDVVLGFNRLADYLERSPYFGAITGRVAGRIPAGRFTLGGKIHQLALNDGANHLHGGITGLDKRVWQAAPVLRPDGADSLRLHYFSPDGEEGYPGALDITVTYTLTDDNAFIVETATSSDRPTPVSLTHHSYFNLAGEGNGTIADHLLQITADRAIALADDLAPLGHAYPVAGLADDFTTPRRLDDAIPGIFQCHGALYCLDRPDEGALVAVARLSDPASGRVLDVSTTEHCLQLYTSSVFDGTLTGKSGRAYPRHAGICFECEGYPDGVNTPGFGNILVDPERPQRHTTVYAFSTF